MRVRQPQRTVGAKAKTKTTLRARRSRVWRERHAFGARDRVGRSREHSTGANVHDRAGQRGERLRDVVRIDRAAADATMCRFRARGNDAVFADDPRAIRLVVVAFEHVDVDVDSPRA